MSGRRLVSHFRNVGIVAHIDAGKTTTSEQMLYISGETQSVGRVDDGDTVMDFLPQEKERGITIQSAAITFPWKDHTVNLIDTPGHVDFTVEVERSARVLDGAVLVIDAVAGVQAQTRTVWKQTRKQNTPAIAFVNKMDRDGASFNRALNSIRSKLGANPVPIQYPIGAEDVFLGVVDLLSMTKVLWGKNANATSRTPVAPIIEPLEESDPIYEEAKVARQSMIESIADHDEAIMEAYLASSDDGLDLSIEDLIQSLRKACLSCDVVPALCGAALRGKGVEALLDSVITFLPSPADRPSSKAVNKTKGTEKEINLKTKDLCALCFKIVHDKNRGPLVFVRTYSGVLKNKQVLYNSSQRNKERLNQLLKISADDYDTLDEVGPGNVACLVGLKNIGTGDTIVAAKSPLQEYVLDGLEIPDPVYSVAIEPTTSSKQTELEEALEILQVEDPSLQVVLDKESGQTLLKGIGELHMEIVCDKLLRQYNIEVIVSKAYVGYKEGLQGLEPKTRSTHVYDRTINLKRLFAQLEIETTLVGYRQPSTVKITKEAQKLFTADEYDAVQTGIESAFTSGPEGYPILGVHIDVVNVVKDQDTTAGSMRACAALAVRNLLKKKDTYVFLEPHMSLEVDAPTSFVGDILSDLTVKRRGTVKEVVAQEGMDRSLILGSVPFATMLGYATSVRSMTQGEGSFSMEYMEHAPVDLQLAKEEMAS
jgi:elongation factor G